MGQYKVPQNVETEDKILGPLSVKQFIYVIIGLLWGFLMWRIFSFSVVVAVIFALPVTGFFLLLGFGSREGVPFEDYVVAFIRFLIVPRQRIWIKDDRKDVIVKDPEKPKENLEKTSIVTTGQLKQLANIIDTRGNFKDPTIQLHEGDNEATIYAQRIIGPQAQGDAQSPDQLATQKDDVLDENSQRAAAVGELLQSAKENTRDKAATQVQQAINKPGSVIEPSSTQPATAPSPNAAQVAMQGGGLTIKQVALRANEQAQPQPLEPGASVQLKQQSS